MINMASKKIIKRKSTIKKVPRRVLTSKKQITYEPQASTSYEEALIKGILSNKSIGKTTEYSILFNSVLSTLTPGLKNLHYKSGVSAGRTLYEICKTKKHYIWYEESIADLVAFFEKAGFTGTTYNVYPDRIDIRFNNRDRTYLGAGMHAFECGLICGFLSAGKRQHVKVEEVSCSNNNSKSCHFVTSDTLPLYLDANGHKLLGRFADSIKEHINPSSGKSVKAGFAEEYFALSSSAFLEPEYHEHMKRIVYYLGAEMGAILEIKSINQKSARILERLYALLGLCKLSSKAKKQLQIEMRFDRIKAKKGLVDISIAFLNGLLKDAITGKSVIKTKGVKTGDSYVVRITESTK